MSEVTISQVISRRRALSLVGWTAALGLAAPAAMLTVSDAEAQTHGMGSGGQAATCGVRSGATEREPRSIAIKRDRLGRDRRVRDIG
jgi:hypothetical protein